MASREEQMKHLVSLGFLPEEAEAFAEIKETTPYFQNLIRERLRLFNKSIKKNWTAERYIGVIKARYVRKGWLLQDDPDPWQMLRSYEDRYKLKNPDYSSPWVKKQKDFRHSKEKVLQLFESQMDASMKIIAEQVREWRKEK